MYVAQIILPQAEVPNEKKGVSLKPNMALANQIFSLLHNNAYIVRPNYKFALGFPEMTQNNLGRVIQVFSNSKNDLIKHIKTNKLYNLITGYCSIKIVEVSKKMLENSNTYTIKKTKDDYVVSLSEIKRIIKRNKSKSKILDMHKQGLSAEDIHKAIKKENQPKKCFLYYKTKNNRNCIFFLEKIKANKKINNLDIEKTNSFGMYKELYLPNIIL